MRRFQLSFLASLAFVSLLACGSTSQTATTSTPSATAPAQMTPSATTAAALDPCVLVTQQEASQLAGASFNAGKEETTAGGDKICTYGAQTLNVLMVQVAVAVDAAHAQADWAQEESKAQAAIQQLVASQGANVNFNLSEITLSGADKAAIATASGTIASQTLNISAIYVLKGPVFFTISDLVLNQPAPTSDALQAQAKTVLTRLP